MTESNENLPLIHDPNEICVSPIKNGSTETAPKSEPEVPAKEQKSKTARPQLVGPMQFVIRLLNLKYKFSI